MSQPTKEEVREWLSDEIYRHRAPCTPAEIRRKLGWTLVQAERKHRKLRDS